MKSKKKNWDDSPRKCPFCGKQFAPYRAGHIYCSSVCAKKEARRDYKMLYAKHSRDIIEGKPIYTNFNELLFWNEKQFAKWFKNNYALFGFKTLRKINRMFPDVIAETYDGKILRIELELCAPNFVAHGHDPMVCDLIISFVKPFHRNDIRGVPIIAIFNGKGLTKGLADYNPESLKLTDYFQKIVATLNSYLLEFLTKAQVT